MSQTAFPFSKEQFNNDVCDYLEVKDINTSCDFELLLRQVDTSQKIGKFNKKFYEGTLSAYAYQMCFARIPSGRTIDGEFTDESCYLYRQNGVQGCSKLVCRAISLRTGAKVVLQKAKKNIDPQEMLRREWACINKIKAIDSPRASYLAIPEKTALEGEVLIVPFAGEDLFSYMMVAKNMPLCDLETIFHDLSAALVFLANPSNFINHVAYLHTDIVAKNICLDVRGGGVFKASLIDLESLMPVGHWAQGVMQNVPRTTYVLSNECIEACLFGGEVTSAANLYSMGVLLLRGLAPTLWESWFFFEEKLCLSKRWDELFVWRSSSERVFLTTALSELLKSHDMGELGVLLAKLLDNNPVNRPTAETVERFFGSMLQIKSTRVWEYPLLDFSIPSFYFGIPSVAAKSLPAAADSYVWMKEDFHNHRCFSKGIQQSTQKQCVRLKFVRQAESCAAFQNSARALEWIQEARELDASGANKRVASLLEVLYNDNGAPALILLDGGISLKEYQSISPEKCGSKEIAELIAQMYAAFVFLSHVGRCRTLDLIHTAINPEHLLLQTGQKQSISFQLCGFSSATIAGDTLDHYPIDFYAAPWAMEEYRQKNIVKADRAIDLFGLLHVVWFALEPHSMERFTREFFLRNEETRSDRLAEIKSARDCWLQGNSVSSFGSEMIDIFRGMAEGSAAVIDLQPSSNPPLQNPSA